MNAKHIVSLMLAALMVSSIFIPAVSSGEEAGIDLGATIKEPKPEIGITVDTEAIDFGELLPGETSDSYPVAVTNIGLKALDITADVEDDGPEAIFAEGITVNGGAWNEYSSQLVSDGSDSFDVALHIPDTIVTRGDISGSLTVWAEAIDTPVADFSAAPLSSLTPLAITFTDLSANGPTSWLWNFGDGNTSTEQNPMHTYASIGTYTVSLTATNSAGSDTANKAAVVKLNIYSTALINTNPGAPDAGIPGFVGPDGDGVITTQRLTGAIPTNNHVNPIFTAWASKVIDHYRSDGDTAFNNPNAALGPVTGNNFDVVSLGDLDEDMIDAGDAPGSITLGFNVRIVNGDGPDFACFENGFISGSGPYVFAELGYVEVSTDGITFVRFPSVSLSEGQVGGYGAVDAPDIYNLVGKHVNAYGDSWGTPFDLSDLVNAPEVLNGSVDLDNINFVRIVDIPGNGYFKDSLGNPIYDGWPTWGSGGLDLEAVGVINSQTKQISAGFSASPLSGDAPLTVQFTDQSVNATAWAWDFDNDGVVDSTERNPTYVYNISMTYTVKLTVTNLEGSDIEVKRNLITVSSPPGDFTYTSDGTSITIIGYNGPGGNAIIPSEIEGVPVVAIGSSAFRSNANMTSVIIPNTVTSIGANAFQGCTALTSVTIGTGVASISTAWFNGCTALTAINVDANNGAYTSDDGVLYNKDVTTLIYCPLGKSGSVTIPSSVTGLPASAFASCTKLTAVNIGSGVTSITSGMFNGCTALTAINVDATNTAYTGVDGVLYNKDVTAIVCCPPGRTSVTIPNTVTSIGANAFQSCTALTSVTIPDSVTSIGNYAFSICTALTSVTIPDSVTSIGSYAFYYCTALTSVTIPNTVTSSGQSVFSGCTALTSVTIETGITSIGSYMFDGCTALTSVTIPDTVTSIGSSAFSGSGLVSMTIPSSITNIPTGAFSGCTKLTSIVIPNSVTSIGNSAFYQCTALTSVTIPDSVTSIGTSVFNGCTALTAINVDATNTAYTGVDGVLYNKDVTAIVCCPPGKTSVVIPDSVTTIPTNAFQGCTALTAINVDANNGAYTSNDGVLYNKDVTTLIYCPLGKVSVTIPNGVTSIPSTAISGRTALTSVTIPDSVTTIVTYTFNGCTALTSVTIPNSVTSIGMYAFRDCTALTSVTIPNSVTSIDGYVFLGCTALTSVTIGTGITSIGTSWFDGCTALTAINVDANNGAYTSNDGVLYNKDVTTLIYCPLGKVSVTIPNGVTSIPASAFRGRTALTSVTIPNSVTSIGERAFQGCTALTSIVFSGNAPTVGSNWASGATKLVVYYNESATGFDTPTWNGVPCYPAAAPTAELSANVVSGFAPLTVRFTDRSTNSPSSWAWDFDNDGNVDAYEQDPSWTFNAPGTYTVRLTVSNLFGSDTMVKVDLITVTEPPAPSDWAFFQGNQQLNGYHPGNAPDGNATKWVSEELDAQPSSSVVIAEGKVFVYCFDYDNSIGYIVALDLETGAVVWREQCIVSNPWGSWASPAYHDGLVFTIGDVARYASDGSPAWPDGRHLPDNTNGGPMIAEGKVFIGNWDGHKYFAFDEKTGVQVWEFTAGGYAQGTPSYHDGKLFVTSWAYPGGNVYCLNASDGTEIWHATTGLDTCGSPAIAGGYVYVTTYNFGGDGDLYCFYESNGTQVWSQKIQRTDSTPTVADGKVYVTGGCTDYSPHQTYCFDALTGEPIWSTTEEQDIGGWTCSVVIADGKLFVGREAPWEGMRFSYIGLFALNASNGEVLWETENGGGTVAIYDGVVFTAGIDGRIYAYGPAA